MNIRNLSAYSLAAALSVSALSPLSAEVVNARPIAQTAPSYSHDLRAGGVEGEVVVKFTISASGDVLNPVVASTTNRQLDASTIRAVSQWKFAPAMKDGVAVSQSAVQKVAFTIPELHDTSTTRVVVMNKPATRE